MFVSSPDIVTFNSLIDGYFRLRDDGSASLIVSRMRVGPVRPDLVTFNAMFNGSYKLWMSREAHVFMGLMWKCHSPNVVTYNTFIDLFCKVGDLDMGFATVRDMERNGMWFLSLP